MASRLKSALAYQSIKDMITDGTINDSTPLTELAISEMLGISRTPVRSALLELQNDGLIRLTPNQGICLRELTVKEAKDQYHLRILLEKHLIETSVGRLSEKDFAELEEVLLQQESCVSRHQYKEYLSLDERFHCICYKYNENMALFEVWNRSRNLLYRVRLESINEPRRLQESFREHVKIFEALKSGVENEAERMMLEHVDKGVLSML